MKNIIHLIGILIVTLSLGCSEMSAPNADAEELVLQTALAQYKVLIDSAKEVNKVARSVNKHGHIRYGRHWTIGFFPGVMWQLYNLTKDTTWKNNAIHFGKLVEHKKKVSYDHDVGFIINSSFGNAYRTTGEEVYREVILEAADSLMQCYHPEFKSLQSWDGNWVRRRGWNSPVIIDNMMNLELLFYAAELSGDSSYYKVAVQHAETTMQNHFREDNSSYHVVSYDSLSGEIVKKFTVQGYEDESAWARGQAWGLYGFTMCYRITNDERFLAQAEKIADFLLNHQNLPQDKVPYWDFDAPVSVETPRDASAGAIMASALFELSQLADNNQERYLQTANEIFATLASQQFLAKVGENKHFLLKHSVGHFTTNSEVDVPIIYADYYFLEALLRKWQIENKVNTPLWVLSADD